MVKNRLRLVTVVAMTALFLVGCQAQREIASNPLEVSARSNPVRNISNFDAALSCMDHMIPSYVNEPVIFMAERIPNETGLPGLPASANNMLISALSKISSTNKLVRYVTINVKQKNLERAWILRSKELEGKQLNERDIMYAPRYFLTGAITQMSQDASRSSKDVGLGVGFKKFEGFVGEGNQGSMTTIAFDLNMGSVSTMQILPGVTSNNIMPVFKKSDGTELSIGLVGLASVDFSMEFRSSEGLGSALRALVDLATIELVRKFLNMPYENCLRNPGSIEMALRNNGTKATKANIDSRSYSNDEIDIEQIKQRAALQEREEILWRIADKLGTVEAYQAYLDDFPYGEYADLAYRQRKKAATKKSHEMTRAALESSASSATRKPVEVSSPNEATSERQSIVGTQYKKYVIIRSVTVRSLPGMRGQNVGRLIAGNKITADIVLTKGNWSQITNENGNVGYVFGKPFRRLF